MTTNTLIEELYNECVLRRLTDEEVIKRYEKYKMLRDSPYIEGEPFGWRTENSDMYWVYYGEKQRRNL